MNGRSATLIAICLVLSILHLNAQTVVWSKVKSQAVRGFTSYDLFTINKDFAREEGNVKEILLQSDVLDINADVLETLVKQDQEAIQIAIPSAGKTFQLDLVQSNFVSDDFRIHLSSGRRLEANHGLYYWGVVNGVEESMSAISVYDGELSGLISLEGEVYNIVREEGAQRYLFFKEKDLNIENPFDCFVDESSHYIGQPNQVGQRNLLAANSDNCVNVYVEVDHDIVVSKGGAQQAADYVMAAFNQVAILYANEEINFQISEMLVWDVEDPYTGPSTSDHLNQFQSRLSGQYNGDMAHLVGNKGGGGIAYVDALCRKSVALGYSDIGNTFSNVPAYSWTIEVLTHEIGHVLGSPHTHSCAWNGDNTAIDGCGSSLGYGGCDGPIPNMGTIMSYCHLVQGAGIDFNLGFGPQPGDLIRDRVYNAGCLSSCGAGTRIDAAISAVGSPVGQICVSVELIPSITLTNAGTELITSVAVNYRVDNGTVHTFHWTGSLAAGSSQEVMLPVLVVTPGTHTFTATTSDPNGTVDDNPANDSHNVDFTVVETLVFYADSDGDGFGDPNYYIEDCSAPLGYVADDTDCNDNDAMAYPGASCNDEDACTSDDELDEQCQCSGTFQDSDGDGVCNSNDICEGGDDNVDSDNDGIPDFCDCSQESIAFSNNPLNHSGSGSSTTMVVLDLNSNDASFSIAGLDAVLKGNPTQRYEDVVVITYVDGNGTSLTYGTFSGDTMNEVTISIQDVVSSITVTLQDGYDGNSQGQSVSLSEVVYCASGNPCVDTDEDGVCDENDPCPNLDQTNLSFDPASLMHAGIGANSSLLSMPANTSEVAFTISNLNARTNGNPRRRYIEVATVYFDDGTGEQILKVFRGDQIGSAEIHISGVVRNVRVELSDGYNNGANGQNLSISLGDATACVLPASLTEMAAPVDDLQISVFPNPATDQMVVDFSTQVTSGSLRLSDILGNQISILPVSNQRSIGLDLHEHGVAQGVLLLTLSTAKGQIQSKRVIVSH